MAPIVPDPEVPDFEGTDLTNGYVPAALLDSFLEQNPKKRVTGDHIIDAFKKIAAEWTPEDKGGIKFRDDVIREVEHLANRDPDYDTGYFEIEAGWKKYPIEHKLGRIPTRYCIYMVGDPDATEPKDNDGYGVYPLSPGRSVNASGEIEGIALSHSTNGEKSTIHTHGDYVFWTRTSAYIRVLLWR